MKEQYNGVFSAPRQEWKVTNPEEFFSPRPPPEPGEDDNDLLADIPFTVKDIELACSELRGNAAPGPNGVPAMLLKTCRKQLATPLHHLWRGSLDSGSIPPELLLVLITPLHKGGSRAVPKNYRPVAIIPIFSKVLERVIFNQMITTIMPTELITTPQLPLYKCMMFGYNLWRLESLQGFVLWI